MNAKPAPVLRHWGGFFCVCGQPGGLEGRRGSDNLHRTHAAVDQRAGGIAHAPPFLAFFLDSVRLGRLRQDTFFGEPKPRRHAKQGGVRHGRAPGMIHQDCRWTVQLDGGRGSNPVSRMPRLIARSVQHSSSRMELRIGASVDAGGAGKRYARGSGWPVIGTFGRMYSQP